MKTSRLQNVLKLLFVAIGINGLVLASAFSQEPSTVTTDAQKPNWALQFQINDNFFPDILSGQHNFIKQVFIK